MSDSIHRNHQVRAEVEQLTVCSMELTEDGWQPDWNMEHMQSWSFDGKLWCNDCELTFEEENGEQEGKDEIQPDPNAFDPRDDSSPGVW